MKNKKELSWRKRIKACMECTDIHLRERERACAQKEGAEAANEHVKACQQHACNTFAKHTLFIAWLTDNVYFPEQRLANELHVPIYAILCDYVETRIELIEYRDALLMNSF
jgi:hypothetical protein